LSFCSVIAVAGTLCGTPAEAQKSKDTLRIALNEQVAGVSPYDFGLDEMVPLYVEVYTPLVTADEINHRYVGELAKSWKQVNDTTLEFELRDDIILHTGKRFTADDIVTTINYLVDPAIKVQNKQRYMFVKSAEKLGPYAIRVHLAEPFAMALFQMAYFFTTMDGDVLKGLENGADYGRVSAASAGPYKVVSVDRNNGFVLERFDKLSPALTQRRAPIQRIQVMPILDRQTQVAQLLTSGVDVLRNVAEDTAKSLAKEAKIKVTPVASSQYVYLMLDALARSGKTELRDVRVRKAIFMAINRTLIAREVLPGGEAAVIMEALCLKAHSACSYTTQPYPYDPAEAKKLLAEAGYPNGFDLPLFAYTPVKDIAVAISGDLRKIGINATVQPVALNVYRKMRDDGELTAFVANRPTSNFPDTTMILDGFFVDARDYWRDPIILNAMKIAANKGDESERALALRPALDRNNQMAYVLPIASMPWVFAHSPDVRIENNILRANAVHISDFFWH